MDLLIVVVVSALTAVLTCALSVRRSRRGEQSQPREILLPPPGPNLELYSKVKELFDGVASERTAAEAERDEAREESVRLKAELDAMTADRDRVQSKLKSATDVLRGWTHSKMDFSFDRRSV